MDFINYLINGISLGSVYVIITLGYIMVYDIVKMLNFIHGDAIMAGNYVVFVTVNTMRLPPMAGVLLAVIVYTLSGMTIERIAYKPLRGTSPLAVPITVISVSCLLQNVTLFIFKAGTKPFTSVVTLSAIKLAGGEMTTTGKTIVTIFSCIVIMIRLTAFIDRSRAGQVMLAISEDRGVAILTGINVNGTIALIFAIGFMLTTITGVLLCSTYLSLTPHTGSMPGIRAFTAAVFGGIGLIPGAFIGGILLGVIEILSKAYISSRMSDAIVFSALIIVFLARSIGILGKRINGKVQVPI